MKIVKSIKHIYILLILLNAFTSCKLKNEKNSFLLKNNFFKVSLGVSDTTSISKKDSTLLAIEYLNLSKEKLSISIIGKICDTVGFTYNTYRGIEPKNHSERLCEYLTYRYNNYLGELNIEREFSDFEIAEPRNNSDTLGLLLGIIEKIEFHYNEFYRTQESKIKLELLDSIKKNLNEFPTSKRLQYLAANMNFSLNNYKVSIPIYYNLLRQNYYSYKIIRKLVKYYEKIHSDSSRYFLNLGEKRFPDRCFLEGIPWQTSDSSYLAICQNCLHSINQRDSLKAQVYLAKFYLIQRNFKKVREIYTNYHKNNDFFTIDSLKDWEKGEYYDLMLSAFFEQGQYKNFTRFCYEQVGTNSKIKVDSDEDFIKLLNYYFNKYPPKIKYKNFQEFFQKNFSEIIIKDITHLNSA